MSKWYRVSNEKFTCAFKEDNCVVVDSAPILKRFVGQPVLNLFDWLDSIGEYQIDELKNEQKQSRTCRT